MRRLLRPCALLIAPILALLAGTVPAWAHPMGNFSINHYAAISVGRDSVRVLYVVDMAEIPTFQELGDLNAAHSAQLTPAQRRTYLASKARALGAGLQLAYDGRPLRLSLRADDLLFPPGAGGLPTERIYLVLEAALPSGAGTLSYRDANFPDRAGWKEIVSGDSGRLLSSTATTTSRSRALTIYPSNATSSPPQDLSATLAIGPWGAAVGHALPAPFAAIREAEAPLLGQNGSWSALERRLSVKGAPAGSTSWAQGRMDALTALISRKDLSPAVLALSLLIACVLGAFHAFSPGHGKTVVAAYIVGSRANAWHALLLGLTVTVTHTAGVFVLGLVTLALSHYIVPDQLYPWLGAISGLGITAIGITLALRRFAALRRPASGHAGTHHHAHLHHDHDGTPHVHLPDGSIIRGPHEEGRYATL
jgi:hypothetical protein